MRLVAFITMFVAAAVPVVASAQTPPRRIQTPASRFSVDTAIRDLIAHPAARAALQRHMPTLATSEHLPQFQHMSVRELAGSPHARISGSRVQALQADLVRIR